jgi:hypothetical protein
MAVYLPRAMEKDKCPTVSKKEISQGIGHLTECVQVSTGTSELNAIPSIAHKQLLLSLMDYLINRNI